MLLKGEIKAQNINIFHTEATNIIIIMMIGYGFDVWTAAVLTAIKMT